jgi:hypothetical protein
MTRRWHRAAELARHYELAGQSLRGRAVEYAFVPPGSFSNWRCSNGATHRVEVWFS